ncbi:adenylate/guanylate cyclase domain-containing protein [Ensifer adhaerens]|uniref:adenylate/guanylate cyclase domain-containing protein n=1 Tax=Ensifer adhaerens TaxID=106592 RepID=UPI003CEEC913
MSILGERRLAAIFVADIVSYSRLVELDEASTLVAVTDLRRRLFEPLLAQHHGRLFKLTGDGLIAEFGSVVEAVACAAAVQKQLPDWQARIPAERRIVLRIGINLGDVLVDDQDQTVSTWRPDWNSVARQAVSLSPGQSTTSSLGNSTVGSSSRASSV